MGKRQDVDNAGKHRAPHRNAEARADARDPAKVAAAADTFWKLPSDQAMALYLYDYPYMEASFVQRGYVSPRTVNMLFLNPAIAQGTANADAQVPWTGTPQVTVTQP